MTSSNNTTSTDATAASEAASNITSVTTNVNPPGTGQSRSARQRAAKKKAREQAAASSPLNGASVKPSGDNFRGTCEDMNGHVFQVPSESNDPRQYEKTLEELQHYANRNLKNGASDLSMLFGVPLRTPRIERPTPPKDKEDAFEQEYYKQAVSQYLKRELLLTDNLIALYSVVWGQCSEIMQGRLSALGHFKAIQDAFDVVALLSNNYLRK